MFNKSTFIALALTASAVLAQVSPTSPSGNTVVKQGEDLQALWDKDASGAWKDVEIQLMTGDNWNMVPLTVLAQGLDGTTQTEFSIPCPEVMPNAKIYFLQFTQGGNVSTATWTTRFTIAAADGSTTEPTETTQPNGDRIGWGTGALVGTSGGAASAPSGAGAMVQGAASSASGAVSSAAASASEAVSGVASSASSVVASASSAPASASSSMSTSRSAINAAANSASASASASARPSGAALPNVGVQHSGFIVIAAAIFGLLA